MPSCVSCVVFLVCSLSLCGASGVASDPPCHEWPYTCPGSADAFPRSPYKQSWQMNKSTIIMPCNDTGMTDPAATLGWSIVDFDWSNSKGTGSADGWAKHKPMDDEKLLFEQVQATTSATAGTTVWVYRNSVYAYPWYASVRKTLEDPAYQDWYFKFAGSGPWYSKKCDSAKPDVCSDLYHSQEQSPGYPHGDGDCTAPGCDCGGVPCGFYIWNHSSTTVVNGQSFRDWFINHYILNEVGRSPLVSGFFLDDVWDAQCNIHDQVPKTCDDMGLPINGAALIQLTKDYNANMAALREAVLNAGKFSWQMLWTGGPADNIGGTGLGPLVTKGSTCAATLRSFCNASSPPQTRAMAYGLSGGDPSTRSDELLQDLANFLLIRGKYAWLGWGWKGCGKTCYFPPEFNADFGEPVDGMLCAETGKDTGIFQRDYTKSSVQMDCNTWQANITMK